MAKQNMADLRAKLQQIKLSVKQQLEGAAVEMANSVKAIAERQIVSSGLPGERYSEASVPAFFLYEKTLNKRGDAFLKKKSTVIKGTNWMELRIAQGLQADHVDLYYSGDMWRNIVVVRIERKGAKIIAILGGKTKESQDKMDWNRDRYGEFILDNVPKVKFNLINKIAQNRADQIIKNSNL